jgi:hypothetical protein
MSNGRFSIVKRNVFSKINVFDFIQLSKQFCEAFLTTCPGGVNIQIELYNNIPTYNTTLLPDIIDAFNKKNEKIKTGTFNNFDDLSTESFSKALYIRVLIEPNDPKTSPSCTFGTISCKGKLPRHIVFFSQPDKVSNVIADQFLTKVKEMKQYTIVTGIKENANLVTILVPCTINISNLSIS